MHRFIILTAALCLLLSASCKKEKTQSDLLTAHCWLATAITIDPPFPAGSIFVTDLYAELPACERDDIWCFTKPSAFTFEEGTTKCEPLDPVVSETGAWEFAAKNQLTVSPASGDPENWEVLELTSEVLQVRSLFDEIGGVEYFATFVFKPN